VCRGTSHREGHESCPNVHTHRPPFLPPPFHSTTRTHTRTHGLSINRYESYHIIALQTIHAVLVEWTSEFKAGSTELSIRGGKQGTISSQGFCLGTAITHTAFLSLSLSLSHTHSLYSHAACALHPPLPTVPLSLSPYSHSACPLHLPCQPSLALQPGRRKAMHQKKEGNSALANPPPPPLRTHAHVRHAVHVQEDPSLADWRCSRKDYVCKKGVRCVGWLLILLPNMVHLYPRALRMCICSNHMYVHCPNTIVRGHRPFNL
jgi:hypothetical protein